MTKKAIGFTVVLISLVMAVPLSAKGPATGKNGRSPGILTDKEIQQITYMREEEKLARDVYLTLYELYQAPIFENISESEQRHMDALKVLLEKKMIRILGRKKVVGNPLLYGTTHTFLEHFGLKRLKDLDEMEPMLLMGQERATKRAASPSAAEPVDGMTDDGATGEVPDDTAEDEDDVG